ncbi:Rz-like lysis system protein LysB [Iodobacter sp. CM08]|nr:Rz-like lysis system protein LysB [Iodobacter sp. CM08]MDW5417434.1 Rz-like lysis system protein LysB [Iodobacter sp. CM08]
MSFSKIPFIALLIILIGVIANNASHRYKMTALRMELEASQQEAAINSALLQNMHKVNQANDMAQADLRSSLESVNAALLKNKRAMEQLKHESKEVRDWADTRLPADVIRLRQRPEIASGAAYQDWLSRRASLPLASEPSPNQRRAESSD